MHRLRPLTLVSLLIGIIIALAGPGFRPDPAALGANQNIGYADFSFGNGPGVDATADKPQSKLWFNDGFWWAVMFDTASNTWHIYKLNWPNQWVDTGTLVDNRPTSRADALWDGQRLYIASLVRFSSSNQGRLSRFSYNANTDTYTRDIGFPIQIMAGSAETLALDKDTTGRLWITFTQNNRVYVNSSTTDDKTWGAPFVIPTAQNIGQDDISSLVAYRDKNGPSVGVLWSSHTSATAAAAMYFAYHKDSDPPDVWQPIEAIYGGVKTCLADDHINLKSLQSDPSGAIFAALKTSVGDSSSCTGGSALIRLVVRYPDNTWKWTTFGTKSDDHTRPIVLLDTTNRKVYMFATSPTSCGTIYMKSTGMDNPDFSNQSGKGTPFISSSTYTCINNATTTKQTVDAVSDLVVMAADENKKVYLHNVLDLGTPTPRLTFSISPMGAQVGAPFETQPAVTARDAQGRVATNFNGPIALALKGPAGATLSGATTVNAVGGVATFSGLSINQAGTGYQLTASAMAFTSSDSPFFDVAKANQAITFTAPPNKRYLDPPLTLSATATSGLLVSFSDIDPNDACAVSGNRVSINHAGVCAVRASQTGDANYHPATDVVRQFFIAKADQTIAFDVPPDKRFGDPPFRINAVTSSGLPVSFAASGGCTISDQNLVTLTSQATCVIEATQPGNADYNAAPAVTRMIDTIYIVYIPLFRH